MGCVDHGLNDGKLFLLNVLPAEPRLPVTLDPLPKGLDRAGCKADLEFQKLVSCKTVARVWHEELVRRGPVADVVSDIIEEKGIDLLVTDGWSLRGSGAPGAQSRLCDRIRDASYLALPYALDFANTEGGELLLLHVVAPVPIEYIGPGWYSGSDLMQYELDKKRQVMQKLQSLLPEDSQRKCLVEHMVQFRLTAEGILEVAAEREADLFVLGVRESGAASARLATHLPWTTVHETVRQGCPVLTVKVRRR